MFFCGTTTYNKVPGGVYLCQVNENISCGACCGLYNVADPSFDALMEMLSSRTERFAHVKRDIDGILAFKEETEARESQERPYPDFHHCPYIGLVGRRRSRVGCLLYPLGDGNKGTDFRGLSFYGGMACSDYFCLTHHYLPMAMKEIVREIAQDWYLYGLIITETKMLHSFFQEVEQRCNRSVTKEDIIHNNKCIEAVREFFELKVRWPFRTRPLAGLCNYFFEDQRYPKPPIRYEEIGETISRYDNILRALESHFNSVYELREAENILSTLIHKVVSNISYKSEPINFGGKVFYDQPLLGT